jgi:DNA-binding response OmpR family regulator
MCLPLAATKARSQSKLEANQRHPQFILTIHGLGYKFSD